MDKTKANSKNNTVDIDNMNKAKINVKSCKSCNGKYVDDSKNGNGNDENVGGIDHLDKNKAKANDKNSNGNPDEHNNVHNKANGNIRIKIKIKIKITGNDENVGAIDPGNGKTKASNKDKANGKSCKSCN